MIGEIQIFDVFAPAALVWAVLAGALVFGVTRLLMRLGFYSRVWHPGLFDVALFVLLWAGLSAYGDYAMTHTTGPY